MATICNFYLLLFFTITLSVVAKLNLDASDHHTIMTILGDLGVSGELPCSDNLCDTTGIFCEQRISKESYVLKVTRIAFKSRKLRVFISPAIGQLSELKELSLPNNYLVDPIPPQIAHCRKLEVFNLRNNKFSGQVPGELSSLLRLRILDLSSNKFSGKVPGELSSLLRLRILDLSSNKFSGYLGFLKYYPNLEKVTLDNKIFTGKVPESLCPSLEPKKPNYKRVLLAAELTDSISTNNPQALPLVETPNDKHRKKFFDRIIVPVLISTAVFSVLFVLITVIVTKCRETYAMRRRKESDTPILLHRFTAKELAFLKDDDLVAALQVIGRGGCGEVYKMEMEIPRVNIKTIAIKKVIELPIDTAMLTEKDTKDLSNKMNQIRSEILTGGHIRHRNLLPLLGHVSRPTCHYLVYKFMQNGSLQDIMQQVKNGTRELDWPARHRIALGVIAGLEYLHFSLTPRIVHRDIKPANVLLNDDMTALITDFGLAKSIPDSDSHKFTPNIAGTFGYIAPEYHETKQFTDKCDIYSFGVLLGVLVIGKFPCDEFFQNTPEMSMVRWMWRVMTSDKPKEAIDANLLGNGYEEQMLEVFKIACFCTKNDPKERPDSMDCGFLLAKIQGRLGPEISKAFTKNRPQNSLIKK